ncbi:class I SAM-dependent methyltransferase [Baekduia soli]|uniref:Class I SAM-dependent methyltransferase n=1 Tax=Baekduia soli TaxID=496014 RepID=A0A5B8U651_9ACTN|nr:class I SAM-dependent methyltransferase [Baekduia soli]QEC48500.1 class I SAM-dependent methyltransferase [Baekduia soli]
MVAAAGRAPAQARGLDAGGWEDAYRNGRLDYYDRLDELARYSLLAGYVRVLAPSTGTSRPRVLDVGAGTGILRGHLDGIGLGEYVGVDLSAAAVAAATARGHAGARFVTGDVASLDLGTFDVIALNEMLYYVAEPETFLARIEACLASAGVLVVSMWRHPGDRSLWRLVDDRFPRIDRVEARNRANPVNRRGWWVSAHRRRDAATLTIDDPA